MSRLYDKRNIERPPIAHHTQAEAGSKGLTMPSVPFLKQVIQNKIHSSACSCSSCARNTQTQRKAILTGVQGQSDYSTIQRRVINEKKDEATIEDIINFIQYSTKITQQLKKNWEIEELLKQENENFDKVYNIENFLFKIKAISYGDEEKSDDDEDWDPADYAEDPIEYDDISSGEVRKYLRFQSTAKTWMKTDTPKKNGAYICHICNGAIKKNHAVDMDHLPPWKDRLKAFISIKKPTSMDDISGPDMGLLYNMRGSVFAHQYCNRSHKGEDNYKKKWGTAENWFNNDGGSPF